MFDDDTLSRLRIVLANSARALNSTVTTAGLTPTEASVLGLIYSRGPLPSSALRELEGLNATMLSRMVSALTRRGLVIRRPDPNDQRAAVLEVTDDISTSVRLFVQGHCRPVDRSVKAGPRSARPDPEPPDGTRH